MLLPWNAEFSSIQFWDEHYSSPFTHDHLCDRRAARTHQIKDFVVIEPGFLTSLPEIDSAKIERVAKPNAFSRRASSIKFSTAMKAPPFGSAAYADLISCFFFSRFQSCNIIPNGNHIRLGCTLFAREVLSDRVQATSGGFLQRSAAEAERGYCNTIFWKVFISASASAGAGKTVPTMRTLFIRPSDAVSTTSTAPESEKLPNHNLLSRPAISKSITFHRMRLFALCKSSAEKIHSVLKG